MILPHGLKYHCNICKLVVPSDSPVVAGDDCASIVYAKLSWFDPSASRAAQFAMAAGTWSRIHWAVLQAASPHPAALAYEMHVHTDRKTAYAGSAARAALSADEVTAEAVHPNYAWLHEEAVS